MKKKNEWEKIDTRKENNIRIRKDKGITRKGKAREREIGKITSRKGKNRKRKRKVKKERLEKERLEKERLEKERLKKKDGIRRD